MRVGTEMSRAFQAEGAITKRGTLGGAGNDTDVIEHECRV